AHRAPCPPPEPRDLPPVSVRFARRHAESATTCRFSPSNGRVSRLSWNAPVERTYHLPDPIPAITERPTVSGKFLFVGTEKLFVRGVTYGPFRPDETGCEYHDRATVEQDFAQIAANGCNAVRTYTVPPRWLLD